MIQLAISGACGKMGQTLAELAKEQADAFSVVAGVDPRCEEGAAFPAPVVAAPQALPQGIEVLVDFSLPVALPTLLAYAEEQGVALVLAATGYSKQDVERIGQASARIPIFRSANMSYGINVLSELCQRAAGALGSAFDVEIREKHHRRKADAPSGTAYLLADALREAYPEEREIVLDRHARHTARSVNEIGIVAVRGGTVTGEHEVGFYGDDETLLLIHSAQNRAIYARGALRAAKFIAVQKPGLYGMHDLLLAQSLVQQMQVERAIAMVSLSHVQAAPQALANVFGAVRTINIDMISQTAAKDGQVDVSFSLPDAHVENALSALEGLGEVQVMQGLIKLSIEGVGMAHAPGVASQVFDALAGIGVVAHLITTSETKISVLVMHDEEQRALKALREAFQTA